MGHHILASLFIFFFLTKIRKRYSLVEIILCNRSVFVFWIIISSLFSSFLSLLANIVQSAVRLCVLRRFLSCVNLLSNFFFKHSFLAFAMQMLERKLLNNAVVLLLESNFYIFQLCWLKQTILICSVFYFRIVALLILMLYLLFVPLYFIVW